MVSITGYGSGSGSNEDLIVTAACDSAINWTNMPIDENCIRSIAQEEASKEFSLRVRQEMKKKGLFDTRADPIEILREKVAAWLKKT